MPTSKLGKLTSVPLREAWLHEAHQFTPWLAENLDHLSEILGVPLELEGKEVSVGPFSADILARNAQDGSLVLIENQLEGSDHIHLGQILTYLAGLEARTVVWIAAQFREPHLSALKWLNEHTDETFSFFAVQLSAVRIGDSAIAPMFDVVARPNTWERRLQRLASTGELSDLGRKRREFWEHYLARHPEDQIDGPATAGSARWRRLDHGRLTITYYLAAGSVGLFVRMEREPELRDALARDLPDLAARLDATPGDLEAGKILKSKLTVGDTSAADPDQLADWLHERLERYSQALALQGVWP